GLRFRVAPRLATPLRLKATRGVEMDLRKETQMKGIVWTQYGPPEVLQFKEVAKPAPKDNEVLVKVQAASINTLDLAMRGPFLARIITGGLLKPKDQRLGVDLAGRVEAVG